MQTLPEAGAWEVQLQRTFPANNTAAHVVDRIAWISLRAHVGAPAGDYRGQTRLNIQATASAATQGTLQRVSVIVRQLAGVYDDRGRIQGPRQTTRNPAWIFAEYALGIEKNGILVAGMGLRSRPDSATASASVRIDWSSIVDWAAYCSAERLTCDYVIDRDVSHREILTLIAQCGRAVPSYAAGKLGVVIDRPRPPTAMISPGNILRDSLSVAWAATVDAADGIEARFIDPDLDWEYRTLSLPVDADTIPARPAIITLAGVTDARQAWREARRQAAKQKYHRRRVSWRMGPEGLTVALGDVVIFSHGLLDGGQTGRVATAQGTTLRLAPPPNAVAPGSRIVLRLPGGSLHDAAVSAVDGEPGAYTLDPPLAAGNLAGISPRDILWRLYDAASPPARLRIVATEPLGDGEIRMEAIDEAAGYYAGLTARPRSLRLAPGQAGAYTLRLDSQPQGRIAITATAPDGWTLQPAGQADARKRVTLHFTPQNWNSPRSITVAAAPDATGGGSIDHAIANAGDPDYRALRFLDDVRLLTP